MSEEYTHTVRQGAWGNLGWLRRKLRKPIKGPSYSVVFRLYLFGGRHTD